MDFKITLALVCLVAWTGGLNADDLLCKSGWNRHENNCYKFFSSAAEKKTWEAAKVACEGENSTLVTIETNSEYEFLKSKSGAGSYKDFWTSGRKSNYTWDDGRIITNLTWFPGAPDNIDGPENRLMLTIQNSVGGMNDVPHHWETPYICEYKNAGSSQCRSGWVVFAGSCYKYFTAAADKKNWAAAKQACKGENSTLVAIETNAEFVFLKTNSIQQSYVDYWTLGRSQDRDHYWIWDDGTGRIIPNVTWYPGAPDNINGTEDSEDRLQIMSQNSVWGMNDVPHHWVTPYICEYKNAESLPCRSGWLGFDSSCYKYFADAADKKNWAAAKQACEGENSTLVAIETSAEFEFLKSNGDQSSYIDYWTSGMKQGRDYYWLWDDGTGRAVANVTWYPNEPANQYGQEDRVQLLYQNSMWGMNDAPHHWIIPYICEYTIAMSTRCIFDPETSQNCGCPGITQQQCEAKNCCYKPIQGGAWCFHPKN